MTSTYTRAHTLTYTHLCIHMRFLHTHSTAHTHTCTGPHNPHTTQTYSTGEHNHARAHLTHTHEHIHLYTLPLAHACITLCTLTLTQHLCKHMHTRVHTRACLHTLTYTKHSNSTPPTHRHTYTKEVTQNVRPQTTWLRPPTAHPPGSSLLHCGHAVGFHTLETLHAHGTCHHTVPKWTQEAESILKHTWFNI